MEAHSIGAIAGLRPGERGPSALIKSLLPGTDPLRTGQRLLIWACLAALAGATLTDFLHVLLGLAPSWESALHGPVVAGANAAAAVVVMLAVVTVQRDRLVWWLVASAFTAYAIGGVLWNTWLQFLPHPPNPSLADGFWMAMYPLLVAALVVSANASARGRSRRILVDGLVAGTAVAALCVAFVAPQLLHAAHRHHGAVVTDLMYPVADMTVGTFGFVVLSIRGWQLNRRWALLTCAFALWLLGDSMWAIQISGKAFTGDSTTTLCYLLGSTLIAAAAWQPATPAPSTDARRSNYVAFAVVAMVPPGILLYSRFGHISLTAFALSWIALLSAMLRTAVAMRDTLILREVERAALTDELT